MKEVIARTEEYKGRKFELSLNFDEKALVDGDFRITARVKTWLVDNPKAVQLAEAEVSIEPDKEGRPILRVTLRGNAAGWEGKKASSRSRFGTSSTLSRFWTGFPLGASPATRSLAAWCARGSAR